jgi:hypothetical protein
MLGTTGKHAEDRKIGGITTTGLVMPVDQAVILAPSF